MVNDRRNVVGLRGHEGQTMCKGEGPLRMVAIVSAQYGWLHFSDSLNRMLFYAFKAEHHRRDIL